MNAANTLWELARGRSARVMRVTSPEPAMERRLKDLGLIPGTWVTCMGVGPFGGPHAYWIRGAVIALRREDAEGIFLSTPEKNAV